MYFSSGITRTACGLRVSTCTYTYIYVYVPNTRTQPSAKTPSVVTRPDWRTSYWPANVNTRMSTPLVSLHHRVQISLPIRARPPAPCRADLAVALYQLSLPRSPPSPLNFTHSPLVVRRVSHLLQPHPGRRDTARSRLRTASDSDERARESPVSTSRRRDSSVSLFLLCTNNTHCTHASSTSRSCCTERELIPLTTSVEAVSAGHVTLDSPSKVYCELLVVPPPPSLSVCVCACVCVKISKTFSSLLEIFFLRSGQSIFNRPRAYFYEKKII